MTAEPSTRERFVQLGPFMVDVSSGEVKKNGERIRLPEQPTRLLLALLERPGEVITREELRTRLWSNDTNVEFEHSIHAAINKLRHALGDSPVQPKFIETVPRRGYRLIAPSIASTPVPAQPTPTAKKIAPIGWRKIFLVCGILCLTLLAVITAFVDFETKHKLQTGTIPQSFLAPSVPRRIAIIGFRNLSDRRESDWLSTAFSEMLLTELGTSTDLQLVSGEDVAQMKRELSIVDGDSFTRETLHRIQQNLGTEMVLLGSFLPMGKGSPKDQVRFDIHLLNTNSSQTVASLSETGAVADLFDLVSDAGLRLRLQLGATPLSSAEQAEIRHSLPENNAAKDFYFSGLEKIRIFDYKAARDVLKKAATSDPQNSLVHEALSTAYGASGYESLAANEAQHAFELVKGLTYVQGLQVEGRYHETRHEWARAEEAYQRLCSLSPQDIDFVLRLAHVQALEGKSSVAIATLDRVRNVQRTSRDDAHIDLAEASIQQQLGDSKKELAAATAAAVQGEHATAPLVIGKALRMQGVALSYLGDSNQALNNERQAVTIFETLKDPGGLTDALTDEGDILSDLGDMTGAETAWRKALAIARITGSKQKEAVIANNLGNVLLMRDEPEQAQVMYQHSYDLSREVDNKVGQANSLLTIGDALQEQGQLLRAKKYYGDSLRLSTQVENSQARAEALESLAGDLADLGETERAKHSAQEAIAAAQASGDKLTETTSLVYLSQAVAAQGPLTEAQSTAEKAIAMADALDAKSLQAGSRLMLAHVLQLQGDTASARTNYKQALTLAESIRASSEQREARYALGELAIEEQRLADAKEMLQSLKSELRRGTNVHAELECLILQAELERLDKQNDAAFRTALKAQSLSRKDDRFDLKMAAAAVFVKAAAKLRKWAQAHQVVNFAMLQASQSPCVACQLKAKLSECDLMAEEGAPDVHFCFTTLQRQAENKGFGLILKAAVVEPR